MINGFHQILSYSNIEAASITLHAPGSELCDYHWHEELELIASLDSKIDVYVESKHYLLEENGVFLINKNVIHKATPAEGFENNAISINISSEFIKTYCSDYENIYFSIIDNPKIRRDLSSTMKSLYQFMVDNDGYPYSSLRINEYLHHILWILLSQCQTHISDLKQIKTQKYKDRYRALMLYMSENYDQPISLEDAASYVGVSKEHLSREFKHYVGEGFREHLANLRLTNAHHDLLYTDMPLVELAIKHGFGDVRTYTRVFLNKFEVTPAQYRRNFKRKYSFVEGV